MNRTDLYKKEKIQVNGACLVAFSSFGKFNFDLFSLESNSLDFKDYSSASINNNNNNNKKPFFFLTVVVTDKNTS